MFGRIRELYDRSKFLAGSKFKAEAETIRILAKKRIMLGRAGAFAAGQNFVGKVRDLGKGVFRAELLQLPQMNGMHGLRVELPGRGRTVVSYRRHRPHRYIVFFEETGSYAFEGNYVSRIYDRDMNLLIEGTRTRRAGNFLVDEYNNFISDYSSPSRFVPGTLNPGNQYIQIPFSYLNADPSLVLELFGYREILYYEIANGRFRQDISNPPYIVYERATTEDVIVPNYPVVQLSDGTVLYQNDVGGYLGDAEMDVELPDDVAPIQSSVHYASHLIRHRAWRKALSDEIISSISQGSMPYEVAYTLMTYPPYSRNVAISSRWDGYELHQSKSEAGSGEITYRRRLRAVDKNGNIVTLADGTAVRTNTPSTGFSNERWELNDFLVMSFSSGPPFRGVAGTEYIEGYMVAFQRLVGQPPAIPTLTNGCVANGWTLGTPNAALASGYAVEHGEMPTYPDFGNIEFTKLDLSELRPDRYTMDKDINGDGVKTNERRPTSKLPWFGKALSPDELITLYPLSYVAQDGEVGMFPQNYDVQTLVAIRVYAGYQFRYKGDGNFEYLRTIPITEGGEQIEFKEFPFVSKQLLSEPFSRPGETANSTNMIAVFNGTVFDDVLYGNNSWDNDGLSQLYFPYSRHQLNLDVRGAYETAMTNGRINLRGIYEWCSLLTTQANSSQ